MSALESSLLELIREASTRLADDVWQGLVSAYRSETEDSRSKAIMRWILENQVTAAAENLPITPHTSSMHFHVECPAGTDRASLTEAARVAVANATKDGLVSQYLVDPISGKSLKTNVGVGMPQVHFAEAPSDALRIRLLMKGNGAEGAGWQTVLPDVSITAAFDLPGVRRAVLEALIRIQGRGCGPGVIGVGIGGDRASGMTLAHRQLFRGIGDRNSVRVIAQLEKQLLEDANNLGIGPLGLGGKTTLLGVKIAAESSPKESCYVSISYLGWTYRRQGVELTPDGEIKTWIYPRTSNYEIPKVATSAPKKVKPVDTTPKRRPRTAREALLEDARDKAIRTVDSVSAAKASAKGKKAKKATKSATSSSRSSTAAKKTAAKKKTKVAKKRTTGKG